MPGVVTNPDPLGSSQRPRPLAKLGRGPWGGWRERRRGNGVDMGRRRGEKVGRKRMEGKRDSDGYDKPAVYPLHSLIWNPVSASVVSLD